MIEHKYKINTFQRSSFITLTIIQMFFISFCLMIMSCSSNDRQEQFVDERIEKLFYINNLTEFNSDPEAISFYENQLNLCRSIESSNVNALRATINYRIGAIYYDSGNPAKAKQYLLKAEELLIPFQKYDKIKTSIDIKLAFHYLESERNMAISNYYNNKSVALVLADSVTNEIKPIEKVRALTNSSETTAYYKKIKKSIEQNLIALNYVEQIEPESSKNLLAFKIYHELSKGHRNLNNTNTDTLKYYIDQAKQYVTDDYLNRFHEEMIGFYHSEKGEIKQAIQYFKQVYLFDKNLLKTKEPPLYYYDFANLLDAQINLGNAYLANNQNQKAYLILQEAKRLLLSRSDFDDDIKTLFYTFSSNYFSKSKNFNQYKIQNDSLLYLKRKTIQNTNEKSFDDISALHNIQKKESQIDSLSSEVERKKSRFVFERLFLLIIGLLTLLTVSAVRGLYFKRQNQTIQQDKKTMELQQKLLKTQMEPHFIFNTLNTLKGLIKLNRKQEAINYLGDFEILLRNTLEQSKEEFIYLGEEIHTLDSYCRLQLARYNYQFDYRIDISSELNKYSTLIPPFLIQPFVENAILHAFRGTKERPSLTVEFEKLNEHDLSVRIFDNGMDVEDSTGGHKSLVGTISRDRFELLTKQFKTDAGFKITTDPNLGTTIKIIIPYKLVEEE